MDLWVRSAKAKGPLSRINFLLTESQSGAGQGESNVCLLVFLPFLVKLPGVQPRVLPPHDFNLKHL